ncbi:15-hydroxyprostaglandin dehydrogenase [NAD(+)] [Aplochiton taeniatus]
MALQDKIALVTGAAQGLGKGFSEVLLQNGAKVALLDINEAAGKSVKAEFDKEYGPDRTLFLACNVESEEQFKAAFQKTIDKFGCLDIVVNNAGIIDEKNWERAVSINLNGVIRGTYLALDHLKKQNKGRGGVIVNTASMAGLGPLLSTPVYTATKHGVVGFTRAMAHASTESGYGVRINAICPGFAQTDILNAFCSESRSGQFSHLRGATEKIMEVFGVLDPRVSEVAKKFLLLVTDETKNGQALMVRTKGSGYAIFATADAPYTPVP